MSEILETLASLDPGLYHNNAIWHDRVNFLAGMVAQTLHAMRDDIEHSRKLEYATFMHQRRLEYDTFMASPCLCTFDEALEGHRCSCQYHQGIVNHDGVCSRCG